MGNAKLKAEFEDGDDAFADELAPGSQLMHGQYTIESFLNAGGFGITYAARDSLDRRVVIKECFPGAFCRRSTTLVTARSRAHQKELASIVRLFVQEARSLAKLKHPNIVGVHQVFEENSTAYMALDFVEGKDLLDIIEDPETTLEPPVIESMLRKILDAIRFIHGQGILHRDISPDNILLNADDEPVLIDFGAAREQASKQSRVLSALRVVKDGYSPQEFYIAGSEQGPYSDLYALGASFYHLLTGELPPNSQARLAAVAAGEADPFQPLAGRMSGYDRKFLEALDKSLAILPKERIGSAEGWLAILDGASPSAPAVDVAAGGASAAADEAPRKSRKGLLLATVAVLAFGAVGALVVKPDLLGGAGVGEPETAAEPAAEEESASIAPPVQPVVTAEATAPEEPEVAALPTEVVPDPEPVAAPDPVPAEPLAPAPDPVDTADALPVFLTPETVPTPVPAEPEADVFAVDIADVPVVAPEVVAEVAAAPEPATPDIGVADTLARAPRLSPPPVEIASARITPFSVPLLPARLGALDQTPLAALALPALPAHAAELPLQISARTDLGTEAFAAPNESDLSRAVPVTLENPETARPQPSGLTAPVTDLTARADVVPPEPLPEPVGAAQPGIRSNWTVRLPFAGIFGAKAGETRILEVNGIPVASREEFDRALRATTPDPNVGEVTLTALVGTSKETALAQTITLTIVNRTVLSNGIVFESTAAGAGWMTRVAEAPAALGLDIDNGDVVFGYIPTNEVLASRTALADILVRERSKGLDRFDFAIKRGENIYSVTFPFDGPATVEMN